MAEPRPINHDAASTGLEVGTKALQYGVMGFLGAAAVGGGLAAAAIGLMGGAAAFTAAAWVGIAVAAGFAAAAWGPVAATGGALFGALKGASNVNREVSSYRMHSDALANTRERAIGRQVGDASVASLQQGYLMGHSEGKQAGIQEGAAMVIQQIQAHEQQMAQLEQQAKAAGGFAAKEDKKRAEQAPTGPQVG